MKGTYDLCIAYVISLSFWQNRIETKSFIFVLQTKWTYCRPYLTMDLTRKQFKAPLLTLTGTLYNMKRLTFLLFAKLDQVHPVVSM